MPNQRSKSKVRFGGFLDKELYRQILKCAQVEGMAGNKFGFLQVLIREGLARTTKRTSAANASRRSPVLDETKSALDNRWAKFRRNPGSALTLEQFKERLKSLPG